MGSGANTVVKDLRFPGKVMLDAQLRLLGLPLAQYQKRFSKTIMFMSLLFSKQQS
jgi:hypothetical protein